MTTFIEEQLTEAMHERVGDIALPHDLVGRALRSQQRRKRIARTAYAGSIVGVAGMLTAGALVFADAPSTIAHNPNIVMGDASPRLRLVAAVSASLGTSYRLRNTLTNRSLPSSAPVTVEGAFDPTSTTGYFRMTDGTSNSHEERLVHGDLYAMDVVDGQTVPWQTDGTRHTNLSYGDKTGLLAVTTDPEQFFNALTEAGATVRQTGAHTYHFDAALMPRRGLASGHLSGDVTVDPSGRIAQVVYEAVLRGTAETAPGTVLAGTLELSGYGSKVTVDRPGGTFEQLPGKPAPEPKPVK